MVGVREVEVEFWLMLGGEGGGGSILLTLGNGRARLQPWWG